MTISTSLLYLLVAVLSTGTLASIGVWTAQRVITRVGALLMLFVAIGTTAMSVTVALGMPKPSRLEVVKTEKAVVLSARMREGVAMYLWLMVPNSTEPRSYVLPWDQDLAQQLQKAQEEAGQDGTIEMMLPFERSWDKKEKKFYATPQPKMPDKPRDSSPGQTYRQQEL